MRSEADWSDSSESEAESTATVPDNPAAGGQVAPLSAPPTDAGPIGAPSGTMPPPPASGSAAGDWGSGNTATAVTPRRRGSRFTPPTVHFSVQFCPKCTDDTIYETRNALAVHLKSAHNAFICSKTGICHSYPRRKKRGGAKRAKAKGSASQPRTAATAPSPPSATSTVQARPTPVPLLSGVGGLGLPPPCQPQMVGVTSVVDVNPFPGPRPLLLDPQTGRSAGRGVALTNLLAGFGARGPGTPPQLPIVHPLDMEVTAALPPPLYPALPPVSVPRPWLHRAAPSTYAELVRPTVVCLPCPLPPTSPPVVDSPTPPGAEVEWPTSWGDQVEAAEERGELAGGPLSTLPGDEPQLKAWPWRMRPYRLTLATAISPKCPLTVIQSLFTFRPCLYIYLQFITGLFKFLEFCPAFLLGLRPYFLQTMLMHWLCLSLQPMPMACF